MAKGGGCCVLLYNPFFFTVSKVRYLTPILTGWIFILPPWIQNPFKKKKKSSNIFSTASPRSCEGGRLFLKCHDLLRVGVSWSFNSFAFLLCFFRTDDSHSPAAGKSTAGARQHTLGSSQCSTTQHSYRPSGTAGGWQESCLQVHGDNVNPLPFNVAFHPCGDTAGAVSCICPKANVIGRCYTEAVS